MSKTANNLFLLILLKAFIFCSAQNKTKLSLDEFFNYTEYLILSFSPTGQHFVYDVLQPSWETNSYSHMLWLYDIQRESKLLITDKLSYFPPIWSPSGKWLAFFKSTDLARDNARRSFKNLERMGLQMYLYSTETNETKSILLETVQPSFITWSDDDKSLYFVTAAVPSKEENDAHRFEWQNVINYRHDGPGKGSVIYRMDIDMNELNPSAKINFVTNVSLLIGELLYVPYEKQLVFTSMGRAYEDLDDFEIYSIHLDNPLSSLSRLTHMEGVEQEIQLSNDGKHILFRLWALSSGKIDTTQRRLYSLDLISHSVDRMGKNFEGVVSQYAAKPDGGAYIVGQLGLNVQIYSQDSVGDDAIHRQGWNGTYERFATSLHRSDGPVVVVFSSLKQPKEIYLANSIDQLMSAKAITNYNELFTQRDLPQAKAYQWKNTMDNQALEGVLHYPPGKFNAKNLPLLVLIHGGPNAASLNELQANLANWATMAATEGWLVLEPNYRGSTGYGDKFLADIRGKPLSLPGEDILMGVDKLIKDGIADPKRLAVGGYSYGGFLTNWLITQTTRFNAALSGAGGSEHVSGWGTMDLPVLLSYLHGGFPWEVPEIYQKESPMYYLSRVRTPTHIAVGESDTRVDADQSFIFERGLHYLKVPVQLLIFPNEGHAIANDPWNGKIKVREELMWLQKYGNQPLPDRSSGQYRSLHIIFISLTMFISKVLF